MVHNPEVLEGKERSGEKTSALLLGSRSAGVCSPSCPQVRNFLFLSQPLVTIADALTSLQFFLLSYPKVGKLHCRSCLCFSLEIFSRLVFLSLSLSCDLQGLSFSPLLRFSSSASPAACLWREDPYPCCWPSSREAPPPWGEAMANNKPIGCH